MPDELIEHEPEYWLLATETDCRELMAGRVTERLREMARMVDWTLENGAVDDVGRRVEHQR